MRLEEIPHYIRGIDRLRGDGLRHDWRAGPGMTVIGKCVQDHFYIALTV